MKRISFLLLMLVLQLNLYAQKKTFRVISYNVLEGFRNDSARMQRFVDWTRAKDPDLIFFQEMNNFTQQKLEQLANRYGHPYAVLCKEKGYPVAISSKYPILNVQKVLDNMWHGYLTASVHGYKVIAVHFSPHQYRKRRLEVAQIIAQAALLPKKSKVILAGDFNSLSAVDEKKFDPRDLQRDRENENRLPHLRNLDNGHYDFSVTNALRDAGFTDTYYATAAGQATTDSVRRRIDYIWTSPKLKNKVMGCRFIFDRLTDELSDHRPVMLDLKE